jgi:DNA-binding transcriptional MerR regulator
MTAIAGSDGKTPTALRTIGELAAETGIATHVLRYWEKSVAALKPLRRSGGRRYYRSEDAALIRRLHHLVSVEGYTLDGAARAVGGGGTVPPLPLATPVVDNSGGAISLAALAALRERLRMALEA